MKSIFLLTISIALSIVVPAINANAQKGFAIGSTPNWVAPAEWTDAPGDSIGRGGGYYYMLFDQQVHVELQQIYTQTAIKVKNEKGLSFASLIEESYDPTYERITFHSLFIQRGTTKINHLQASGFQIIQREENLSRATYDGSLTAMMNLKDVKPGDIVVYSFTRTGFNPVFKNHFFRKLYFNFGSPIRSVQFRVLSSASRTLYFKDSNQPPPVEKQTQGNLTIYQWKTKQLPAYRTEDRMPSWYNPYMRVEITDFRDWSELSEWAIGLFDVKEKPSRQLQSFIDSLRSLPTTEHQIIAAIRTVQDKVRYLSLVDGMSSYKPHPPSSVFNNRYGDCKDKSLLLSQILKAVGVKSEPVLVSTELGPTLDQLLPSPWNFNHCIVKFEHRDSSYFVDPTISFQRGGLAELSTPAYHAGVVADPSSLGLTKIPAPPVNSSMIRATEDFEFSNIGGAASLHVVTVYRGAEANGVRDSHKASTQEDTDQNYLSFYGNEYPNIVLKNSIQFEDDTLRNVVTVTEDYEVPDFWQYDSAASQFRAELYGRVVGVYFSKPSTKSRKAPFTITYPLDVELITNIHLPETWNVEDSDKTIQGPGFVFKRRTVYHDLLIKRTFSYYHTAEFVEANKTSEFVNKTDEMYDELSYVLTYNDTPKPASQSSTAWQALVIILVLGGIFGFLAWRAYQFDPDPRPHTDVHRNIGGWLIIPVVGFGFAPFRTIISLVSEDYFNANTISILANPFQNGSLGVFILLETAGNICLIAVCSLTFALLVTRRTSAPLFATISYVFGIALIAVDNWAAYKILDQSISSSEVQILLWGVIFAAVWIFYLHRSQRSRSTFVNRRNA